MTNNALITVMDRSLGFSLDDFLSLHKKEIGLCTYYIVNGSGNKYTYLMQRFKQNFEQSNLAEYISNLQPSCLP